MSRGFSFLTAGALALAMVVVSPAAQASSEGCALAPRGAVSEAGALDPYYPAATKLTGMVLYLDFSDAAATASDDFDDYLAPLRPDADWLGRTSYGRFDLTIREHRAWIRMSEPAAAYGAARSDTNFRYEEYIREAIALADPAVDFSDVDFVYLVPQRSAPADYSPAHFIRVDVDGNTTQGAVTFGSDMFRWAKNLLTHETGHLIGLPDLYAYDNSKDPDGLRFTGGWDVMGLIDGHAQDLLVWQKHRLGWVDQADLVCVTEPGDTVVKLKPLASATGVRGAVLPVGGPTDRLYVLEYRDGTGLDAGGCSAGVLAYRVEQNGVGSGEGAYQVLDAAPASNPTGTGCVHELDDAVLTPATGTFQLAPGLTATVTQLGATATVTVNRAERFGPPPPPTPHDPAAQCDAQQDNQGRFSDVPASNVHAYNINCIVGHGITEGYPDGTYRPGGTLSRAQTATFVARTLDLAGVLPAWSGTDHFDDDEGVHETAINRLADAGIVATATRSFHPAAPTTRSVMANWVAGAAELGGLQSGDTTDWYGDDDGDPNEAAINEISSLGIVTGNGRGTYGPTLTLSRAQMGTFLARLHSLLSA